MKVWTVSSRDNVDIDYTGVMGFFAFGSYTSREEAVKQCAEYILERIGWRGDFAWSMAHDDNHPEAEAFFSIRKIDLRPVVRRGCVTKLRKYLHRQLAKHGRYYVHDASDVRVRDRYWYFDVSENSAEGELWDTVTWGDSDCDDPDFTTPWPETFTSRETAVVTFLDYVKDLYRSHGMKWSGKLASWIRKSLAESGKVQVDLSDGCCVNCVLNHDDAKNIRA